MKLKNSDWLQARAAITELMKVEHREADTVAWRMGRNLSRIDSVIDPVKEAIRKKVEPIRRDNPGCTEEWLQAHTEDLLAPIISDEEEIDIKTVTASQLHIAKINPNALSALMKYGVIDDVEPVNGKV